MLTSVAGIPRSPSWRRLALVFTVLLGAVRLAVIEWSAPLVPYWDEWTATAGEILKPWHNGQVPWAALWQPHNDHRLVLTRLWEMAWFSLLGQWDPTVVATVNALLLTAAEAAFVLWIARVWTARGRVLWMLASVALLVVPYGYETLLISFQSQYHFLAILGLAAIWAATRVEDARWAAPGAILASALALLTGGAGLLVAVAAGVLAALQSLVRRRVTRRTAGVAAGAITMFIIGWSIRPPPTFALEGPPRIALAAARYAGWPASNLVNLVIAWPKSARYVPPRLRVWPSPQKPAIAFAADFMNQWYVLTALVFTVLALITYLPGACLLGSLTRGTGDLAPPPAFLTLAGLVVWTALNVLGMAIARSDDLLVPPRYQDLLVLGLLANAGSLLALRQWPGAHQQRALRWLTPLWIFTTGAALLVTALGVVAVQLPRKAVESAGARQTVQAYVATGNLELFRHRPPNFVPWPGGEEDLARLLRDPEIRALLPVELRAPPARPTLLGRLVRSLLWVAPGVAGLAALWFGGLAYQVWRAG